MRRELEGVLWWFDLYDFGVFWVGLYFTWALYINKVVLRYFFYTALSKFLTV